MAPWLFAASTFFWQNGEYGVEAATLIIFSMFFGSRPSEAFFHL